MKNSKLRSVLSFYKWHLIFILIIAICIGFIVKSCTTDPAPDLIIGYIAAPYVKIEDFDNNKSTLIEHLLHDANNDGKKTAELIDYTIDSQDDIKELFVDMIDSQSYHIYVLPKEAFIAYKDKTAFATLSINAANVETLKDDSGRVYAYSVEGNTFMETIGFINTENLYIAAANFGNEELSREEKNGMNITREIIEKRRDY